MRVAVVGAAGFIGIHLRRSFEADGIQCTAVSSTTGCFDATTGVLAKLPRSSEPLEAVVYLSQSPYYREVPQQVAHLWAVNVVSALKTAEWARHAGARRFVYASSGNVYRPAFDALSEDAPLRRDDWYALSKVQAEESLALYRGQLTVTAARLFGVYGAGQRDKLIPNLMASIRARRVIRLQPHPADAADAGGVRLSLSYVDDVVDVLKRLALADGPPVLNIAGSDALSVRDIATAIASRLGLEPVFSVEATPRAGDLVADRTALCRVWAAPFRAFDQGLALTLGAS